MSNSANTVSKTKKRTKIDSIGTTVSLKSITEPLKIESSLVSRLNADVVGEIFTFYVDQWAYANSKETAPTPSQPAVYVLCKINQEWRSLARRTPRLWRSLIIWYSTQTWNTCEALISDWIQCAASMPLQIYVFSTEAPDTELPLSLRKTLLLSASKWSSFTCLGPSTPFCQDTLVEKHWSFPQLKCIAICLDEGMYCNLSDAPLLKQLIVRHLRGNVCVRWSQLTLVDIAVEKLEYATQPLKELEAVQELRLTVEQWILEDQLTVVRPKLRPHLRKLLLNTPKQASVIIFNLLTAPALTNVSISLQTDPNENDEDWQRSFLTLISGPGQQHLRSLTTLKLARLGNITEERMVNLLAEIPSVIDIEIFNPGFPITDTTIYAMNPEGSMPGPGKCILPNATHMKLKNVKIQFDGFVLLNMLIRRREWAAEKTNDSHATSSNKTPTITSFKKIDILYSNPAWIRSGLFEDPNLVMLFFYKVFTLRNSKKILLNFCCLDGDPFED